VAGAKQLAERALRIAENTYGPDHPAVATMRSNLDLLAGTEARDSM
jgi:hypothetical protein